ncbi:hypothetical protein A176_006994 [Myxococcus hansupus]|uniref:Uncharacterized protein n=1 Tax=Pseudomyxococcus hansupus TaxID=1297742 RepID=A0A0H4XNX6_9BACT|nr:hypothetical protein A176_006994 [Myxococcus hansupus]
MASNVHREPDGRESPVPSGFVTGPGDFRGWAELKPDSGGESWAAAGPEGVRVGGVSASRAANPPPFPAAPR